MIDFLFISFCLILGFILRILVKKIFGSEDEHSEPSHTYENFSVREIFKDD